MANIIVGTPASIATPAAGYVTLFLDSTNNNILSYKDESGNVYIYSNGNAGDVQDDCCCDIAKDLSSKLACAVKDGVVTMADYSSFMASGISVVGSTTDDGAGNKTCSIVIGQQNVLPTAVAIAPQTAPPISVGGTYPFNAIFTPYNTTNRGVVWSSTNNAVFTVDSLGVITATGAGTATLTATSVVDALVFDAIPVTVI
jgi:uncharacterized protein YjdB